MRCAGRPSARRWRSSPRRGAMTSDRHGGETRAAGALGTGASRIGEASARSDSTGRSTAAAIPMVEKPEFGEAIFAHEEAVKGLLDDARSDMDALTEDARTGRSRHSGNRRSCRLRPNFRRVSEDTFLAAPLPTSLTLGLRRRTRHRCRRHRTRLRCRRRPRACCCRPVPSDAVPVPTGRRARWSSVCLVSGIAVLVGTIWWLRSDKVPATSEAAVRTASRASAPSNAPLFRRPLRQLPLRRQPLSRIHRRTVGALAAG